MRYRKLMAPLVERRRGADSSDLLAPVTRPRHPAAMARFSLHAALPASVVARRSFRGEKARGLFAGLSAHSILPLTRTPSAAFGLFLGLLAHAVGWPLARGGSQTIADGLAGYLRVARRRGRDGPARRRRSPSSAARRRCCSTSRRASCSRSPGDSLPSGYRRAARALPLRPGSLQGRLGARRADPLARRGMRARGDRAPRARRSRRSSPRRRRRGAGGISERPFVLLAQQSLFDPSRAPEGKHTAWAYCHVPNGSARRRDGADRGAGRAVRPGIPRADPRALGDGDRRRSRRTTRTTSAATSTAARRTLRQLLARPVLRVSPYSTPLPGVFLCSSSTPPGGGVHGMCGVHAAAAALRRSGREAGREGSRCGGCVAKAGGARCTALSYPALQAAPRRQLDPGGVTELRKGKLMSLSTIAVLNAFLAAAWSLRLAALMAWPLLASRSRAAVQRLERRDEELESAPRSARTRT